MTIAVIGAGAIGSVVAGYLKKSGQDVTLIGKADQVKAVKARGLTLKGVRGEETIQLPVFERLDKEYDLVVFTVKTQDLDEAYTQNAPFLETCQILTTQNGVQADTILSCHFDRERMTSSIVMFGSTYTKPGEVVLNFEGDWIIGKPYMPNNPHVHEMATVLANAFPTSVVNNITGMKWLKLFVNFNNCIPAVIGKSMQETFADMDFCRLSIHLLKEGVSIVEQANIQLVDLPKFPAERIYGMAKMPIEQAAGIMNKTLTGLSKEPLYGSILQSILRKKTSEIDFINGEIVHLAANIHQKAPLNRKIVELVHKVEASQKFFDPEFVKKEFGLNNVVGMSKN